MEQNILAFTAIAVGLLGGLAALGAAIGDSILTNKYLECITRQPELSGKLLTQMLISIGLIEAVPIIAIVMGFILLYANPLVGK